MKYTTLPVNFGDTVYWISDDNSHNMRGVVTGTVQSIGINDDGSLFLTDDPDYTMGDESWSFLTREDAERYMKDPDNFPSDYARVDVDALDLPYRPGTYYYVEPPQMGDMKWYILKEHYTYVQLMRDGGVCVGNAESMCIMGKDPCFLTLEEAEAFIDKKGGSYYTYVEE